MRRLFRRGGASQDQYPPRINTNGNSHSSSSPSSPSPPPQEFQQQAETLIPAEIRMISGCHSEQTSADLSNVTQSGQLSNPAGRAGGACTSALLELLYHHHNINNNNNSDGGVQLTFQTLLLDLRERLKSQGLDQIPQLSSSRPLELQETPFSLTNGPGQRRALLVGISYRGQSGELSGCHNDVQNIKNYLMRHQGYKEDQILVLMDEVGGSTRNGTNDGSSRGPIFPTRQKIILALQQMVAHSQPGDNVYFHYSGHGGLLSPEDKQMGGLFVNAFKMGQQLQNNHGNNSKYYEETLYPVDHEQAGQIRDFSLFHHFVRPLRAGVTATCVLDCCHSGTVLDLPYQYQPTNVNTIRMQRSMDNLSNLAFLYLLAGNPMSSLGGLFHPVWQHVDQSLPEGTTADDYQGTGLEELDIADRMDDTDFVETAEAMGDDYGDVDPDAVVGDMGDDDGDLGAGNEDDDFGGGNVRGFDNNDDDFDGGPVGLAEDANPVMVVQGQPVDDGLGDFGGPSLYADDYAAQPDDYGDVMNFNDDIGGGGGGEMDGFGEDVQCCDDGGAGCGDLLGALLEAAGTDDD